MRERPKKEKSEFDQKVLDIRRTARVVKGGRRFSFRATVVIGNRAGKVGVGVGKGPDVSSAVEKAVNQAKKNAIKIVISKNGSIPHEVEAKIGSAVILLKPAPSGSGIIAGGPIRVVADLAGIQNLSAKILSRTTNKLNNARATMEAFRRI